MALSPSSPSFAWCRGSNFCRRESPEKRKTSPLPPHNGFDVIKHSFQPSGANRHPTNPPSPSYKATPISDPPPPPLLCQEGIIDTPTLPLPKDVGGCPTIHTPTPLLFRRNFLIVRRRKKYPLSSYSILALGNKLLFLQRSLMTVVTQQGMKRKGISWGLIDPLPQPSHHTPHQRKRGTEQEQKLTVHILYFPPEKKHQVIRSLRSHLGD